MATARSVHGIVRGRVQDVAYRASFRYHALERGLVGWIRNLPDGTVEFLVQGAPAPVQEMIDWAHTGPALARVTQVVVDDRQSDPRLKSLVIRE